MNGLASLSVEAARELMRLRQISEQYFYPSLFLDRLTAIDTEVAAELAKNPDYLSLNGITGLSDEAAEALSLHKGGMSLGVTTLSDYAAEALARSSGAVQLIRLAEVSPKAIASLKARGPRLLMPLQMYSPLEQFLWGLTGWLELVIVTLLFVMACCVAISFYSASMAKVL